MTKHSKLIDLAIKLFNLGYYLALFKKTESIRSIIIPPREKNNPIQAISY